MADDPWDRIVDWLRRHAPVSAAHLGPPATEDDRTLVAALLGRPLPADLTAWWRRSCGVTGFVEGRVIPPRWAPHTIDQAVDCRELMLEVGSCADDGELAALVAQPAGSPCSPYWLPVWLPIAHDGGGGYLFVDLRPGPSTGCVMGWDEYEAAAQEPEWPDTATMLAEIAEALEHGTEVKDYRPETREDGTLDWV